MEAGDYGIYVGTSLAEAKPVSRLHLGADKVLEQNRTICPLTEELNQLQCSADHQKKNRARAEETVPGGIACRL